MTQEEMRVSLEIANEKVLPALTFVATERKEWNETRGLFHLWEDRSPEVQDAHGI
jgi:hypothetical protein